MTVLDICLNGQNFGMTACHPAYKDENGNPRRDLWPPPEGTAPPPPYEKILF